MFISMHVGLYVYCKIARVQYVLILPASYNYTCVEMNGIHFQFDQHGVVVR